MKQKTKIIAFSAVIICFALLIIPYSTQNGYLRYRALSADFTYTYAGSRAGDYNMWPTGGFQNAQVITVGEGLDNLVLTKIAIPVGKTQFCANPGNVYVTIYDVEPTSNKPTGNGILSATFDGNLVQACRPGYEWFEVPLDIEYNFVRNHKFAISVTSEAGWNSGLHWVFEESSEVNYENGGAWKQGPGAWSALGVDSDRADFWFKLYISPVTSPVNSTLTISTNPTDCNVTLTGVGTVNSGPTGKASFENLAPATYTITASKIGYATITRTMFVDADETINITLTPIEGPGQPVPPIEKEKPADYMLLFIAIAVIVLTSILIYLIRRKR